MKTLIICHINRHLVAKYKQSHFTSYNFTKKVNNNLFPLCKNKSNRGIGNYEATVTQSLKMAKSLRFFVKPAVYSETD